MDIENQGELGTEYETLSSEDSYSYYTEDSTQERPVHPIRQPPKCGEIVEALNKIAEYIIYLALTIGFSTIGLIVTIGVKMDN